MASRKQKPNTHKIVSNEKLAIYKKIVSRLIEASEVDKIVDILLSINTYDTDFLKNIFMGISRNLQQKLKMGPDALYTTAYKTKKELSVSEKKNWSRLLNSLFELSEQNDFFLKNVAVYLALILGIIPEELCRIIDLSKECNTDDEWVEKVGVVSLNRRLNFFFINISSSKDDEKAFAEVLYKSFDMCFDFMGCFKKTREFYRSLYNSVYNSKKNEAEIEELKKEIEKQKKDHEKELKKASASSDNETIDALRKELAKSNESLKKANEEKDELQKENSLLKAHDDDTVKYSEYDKLNIEYMRMLGENTTLSNRIQELEDLINNKQIDKTCINNSPIVRDTFDERLFINGFVNTVIDSNLYFDEKDLINFHMAVKSSPLTILAGASGMGKTQLPLAYAKCIGATEKDGTLLFMPISPSYTEPSDVLGFFNANLNKYIPADTGLVELLIHANENPQQMHMVIFDEMNLSQIEYWFAPFMSVLEKPKDERNLLLYSKRIYEELNNNSTITFEENKNIFPYQVELPDNIIFVGTVNLDETTKDMSDRLIDRAIVINPTKMPFSECTSAENLNRKYDEYCVCESYDEFDSMRANLKSKEDYINNLTPLENEFFDKLHKALQEKNPSKCVSFRNRRKIAAYLSVMVEGTDRKEAFDLIFKQTILKKINGYGESISEILGRLNENGDIEKSILNKVLDDFKDVSDFKLTRDELRNKIKEFKDYGFTK